MVTVSTFLIAGILTATVPTSAQSEYVTSAVRIETSVGRCSGVHIGNGRVLTAAHCFVGTFSKAEQFNVKVAGHTGRISWIDRKHDSAEVQIDDYLLAKPYRPNLPVAYIQCNPPEIGDALRHEGFPGATGFIVTRGEIVSLMTSSGPRWPVSFFHDVIAGPGSSGGPLFDKDNKVVALLVGGSPKPPMVAIGVPLSAFCHLIAGGS